MKQYRIATYNLRYANNKDTGNLWTERRQAVANLIRFHDFDVLGTQEGISSQLDDLSEALPQFERYGSGRNDGKSAGEHCAIFFKRDLFRNIRGGTFWFSENPDVPGYGWDARHIRICSWVELQPKQEGKSFFVFNVHFEHYGPIARRESSRLILEKIREIAGTKPAVLLGDFNDDQPTETYRILAGSDLLKDAATLTPHPYLNSPSFNSWGKESGENRHIDHVFVTSAFAVRKYGILTDTYLGKTPSDHFPVMADLEL